MSEFGPKHVDREPIVPTESIALQQERALRVFLDQEDNHRDVRELLPHQTDFVNRFIEYLRDLVILRQKIAEGEDPVSLFQDLPSTANSFDMWMKIFEEGGIDAVVKKMVMTRIEGAPRTGKTTVAAEIIHRTNLPSLFLTPTINLVEQTVRELEALLPGKKIGQLSTQIDTTENADVVVTTYNMLQRRTRRAMSISGKNPAALIFSDEGHESTTDNRLDAIETQVNPEAIRIALSGTPDYSETRRLRDSYPVLIHEMKTPEAIQMGLLSPFQCQVLELDIDGSAISTDGGDFNVSEMGRTFTGLPLYELFAKIRFDPSRRDIPALACFRLKNQANQAFEYLQAHYPDFARKAAVVTEDTPNRREVLEAYTKGELDTLFSVHLLLRGWDEERCKLLVDFDPTLSPVRAGQKDTRPLTKRNKEDRRIAQIISVIPKSLKYLPITPFDVLLDDEPERYLPGYVYGYVPDSEPRVISPPQSLPTEVAGVQVRPLYSLREYGGLEGLDINRNNKPLLRSIVVSGYLLQKEAISEKVWLVDILRSYKNFQNTFFEHSKFKGYGRILLWSLGIKDQKEFIEFVTEIFPEERGTQLLIGETTRMNYKEHRFKAITAEAEPLSTEDEVRQLIDIIRHLSDGDSLRVQYDVLAGGPTEDVSDIADPLLLRAVSSELHKFPPRTQRILIQHAVYDRSFGDIASEEGITRGAISRTYNHSIKRIKFIVDAEAKRREWERPEGGLVLDLVETRKNLENILLQLLERECQLSEDAFLNILRHKYSIPISDRPSPSYECAMEFRQTVTSQLRLHIRLFLAALKYTELSINYNRFIANGTSRPLQPVSHVEEGFVDTVNDKMNKCLDRCADLVSTKISRWKKTEPILQSLKK